MKIKIISDPYRKKTQFQLWKEKTECWSTLDLQHDANSELLKARYSAGFFPFKAGEILDEIIRAYGAEGEKTELVFEGTEDDDKELQTILKHEKYSSMLDLKRSERYLENAGDILPDVIRVFEEVRPIIMQTKSEDDNCNKEEIEREIAKFTDASDDLIPICIIGNYSTGKSTFINALIGYELLPSSDEPTTAKIYRITRSECDHSAVIRFEYRDTPVKISVSDTSYTYESTAEQDPIRSGLTEALKEENLSLPVRLNTILKVINECSNSEQTDCISDIIEAEVPFSKDSIWERRRHNFVIFDTPGSNSASNERHYQVLKKEMENLSNGLPVFVSELDSLDSTDNDKLYQEINNMKELDNRFTMIVVNKADSASLSTAAKQDRILEMAIPRKLNAAGIYFLSSIMGLAAKNNGEFICERNAEVYHDQKNKYTDPSNTFYKELYRYDILPAQIRERSDELSQNHPDRLYANSGLYSVEQAIDTFAQVYSPYNKCYQTQLFLQNVISLTSDAIEKTREQKEEKLTHYRQTLQQQKDDLIAELESRQAEKTEESEKEYNTGMEELMKQVTATCSISELASRESDIKQDKKLEMDISGREDDLRKAGGSFFQDLADNVDSFFKNKGSSNDLGDSFKKIIEEYNELYHAGKEVKKESQKALIDYANEEFSRDFEDAAQKLKTASRSYWADQTVSMKNLFSQIVTDSTAMDEESRNRLSGIILSYRDPDISGFTFNIKEYIFRLGDFSMILKWKLSDQYNSKMAQKVQMLTEECMAAHTQTYETWLNSMMDLIRKNIIEFSPKLSEQTALIRNEENRIMELSDRIEKLQQYSLQISQMMDWKERTDHETDR